MNIVAKRSKPIIYLWYVDPCIAYSFINVMISFNSLKSNNIHTEIYTKMFEHMNKETLFEFL